MKLNLGSGMFYKPGYVNIDDNPEQAVADEWKDILRLDYENDSVDEIEASHILEHFDINYTPYILANLFRMLKPNGSLYLEVPNLRKAVKSLRFKSWQSKLNAIKFLYGIDLPGNFHKSGFTFHILARFLRETGFAKIRRNKQKSFKTEKGLRVEAVKPPTVDKWKNFLALFRSKLLLEFENADTYFFEAVENNCVLPLSKVLSSKFFKKSKVSRKELFLDLVSSFTIFHPKVALIYVEMLEEELKPEIKTEVLNFLDEKELQTLLYNNWLKWKKNQEMPDLSWVSFLEHWRQKIKQSLLGKLDFEKNSDYFLHSKIDSKPFFSFELVVRESLKMISEGVKAYSKGQYEKAKEIFYKAIRLNPMDFLAKWNYARLELISEKQKISEHYYQIAVKQAPRKFRKTIEKDKRICLIEHKHALKPIAIRL
ncbi:MAG: hypothetical protein ACTSYD_07640 [Candidatus Heimdallarchaeaceae archaeon]